MVKRQGFTLVECIIALAIFSSLLGTFVVLSHGIQKIKQHQTNDVQEILMNRFITRLESDAQHYQVKSVNSNKLGIYNTKTDKFYYLGLWGRCLCLYRSDGKFVSYLLDVKEVNFTEEGAHLYQITLQFTNSRQFKEEVYING